MQQNYKQIRKDSLLSDRPVRDSSAPRAVLGSLLQLAKRSNANSIHFYIQSTSGLEQVDCAFNILGKLEPVAKKFSNKILSEIVGFIKDYSNLENNPLKQIQVANLLVPELISSRVIQINNSTDHSPSAQLVIELFGSYSDGTPGLKELGLSAREAEEYKSHLSEKKGIILVSSSDLITAQSFILSCLSLPNLSSLPTLVFDSTSLFDYKGFESRFSIISTPISTRTVSIAKNALLSNPSLVVFADYANSQIAPLAAELANHGKLVFMVTSEKSAVAGLLKSLNNSFDAMSFIQELVCSISLSPIKSVSSSASDHILNSDLIDNVSHFFGVDNLKVWNDLLNRAGQAKVTNLANLKFPKATSYGARTNLVELLFMSSELKKTLVTGGNITEELLTWRAIRSGMSTRRHNGLVRSLSGELDIADVIEVCQ
ncbi:MAG: hypothetical protein QG623_131 [Patescibacteria group bacterium]|nr:hypothetical protein [Patescibacteria group bacterium]